MYRSSTVDESREVKDVLLDRHTSDNDMCWRPNEDVALRACPERRRRYSQRRRRIRERQEQMREKEVQNHTRAVSVSAIVRRNDLLDILTSFLRNEPSSDDNNRHDEQQRLTVYP